MFVPFGRPQGWLPVRFSTGTAPATRRSDLSHDSIHAASQQFSPVESHRQRSLAFPARMAIAAGSHDTRAWQSIGPYLFRPVRPEPPVYGL